MAKSNWSVDRAQRTPEILTQDEFDRDREIRTEFDSTRIALKELQGSQWSQVGRGIGGRMRKRHRVE